MCGRLDPAILSRSLPKSLTRLTNNCMHELFTHAMHNAKVMKKKKRTYLVRGGRAEDDDWTILLSFFCFLFAFLWFPVSCSLCFYFWFFLWSCSFPFVSVFSSLLVFFCVFFSFLFLFVCFSLLFSPISFL